MNLPFLRFCTFGTAAIWASLAFAACVEKSVPVNTVPAVPANLAGDKNVAAPTRNVPANSVPTKNVPAVPAARESANLTQSDLIAVAEKMTKKLFESGKLDKLAEKFADKKPMIFVSDFLNETDSFMNASALAGTLVTALIANGNVDAMADDKTAIDLWKFEHKDALIPQLTLSGKISANSSRDAARTGTKEFLIQAAINFDGRILWRNQQIIRKNCGNDALGDPEFFVEVRAGTQVQSGTQKSVYYDGERDIFSVTATKNAYLNIFWINDGAREGYRLFPSKKSKNNALLAGQKFETPRIKFVLAAGTDFEHGRLIFVLTKNPREFGDYETIPAEKIGEWIESIPARERAVEAFPYEIRRN